MAKKSRKSSQKDSSAAVERRQVRPSTNNGDRSRSDGNVAAAAAVSTPVYNTNVHTSETTSNNNSTTTITNQSASPPQQHENASSTHLLAPSTRPLNVYQTMDDYDAPPPNEIDDTLVGSYGYDLYADDEEEEKPLLKRLFSAAFARLTAPLTTRWNNHNSSSDSSPESTMTDQYHPCSSEDSFMSSAEGSIHHKNLRKRHQETHLDGPKKRTRRTGLFGSIASPIFENFKPKWNSLDKLPSHKSIPESRSLSLFGSLLFSIVYLLKSVRSSLRIYLTSLVSLILAVVIVCVMYQTIQKSNLVFLYLAESNAGEMDFLWTRRLMNSSSAVFLNLTDTERALASSEPAFNSVNLPMMDPSPHPLTVPTQKENPIIGVSARWLIPGTISNPEDPSKNSSAIFLIMDTDKEKDIGIGRYWDHRPLGVQEVHLRDTLLSAVDLIPNRGQEVQLSLNLQGVMNILNGQSLEIDQEINDPQQDDPFHGDTDGDNAKILYSLLERAGFNFTQNFQINVTRILDERQIVVPPQFKPLIDQFGILDVTGEQLFQFFLNSTNTPQSLGANFRVVDSFGGSDGLFPSSLGNVVILDSRYMKNVLQRTIRSSVTAQFLIAALNAQEQIDDFLENFKVTDYAMSVVGQIKDRFKIYQQGQDARDRSFVELTNGVKSILGAHYPIDQQFPLMQVMDVSNFLSLFLDQIFNTVLVILGVISAILINMLLMSNIDDHIYEYGMIRALGLDKLSLVGIILSYSLLFAIPAIIIGLAVACVLNFIVEAILSWYISLPYIDYTLSTGAIVIPILVGLCVPLFANVLPARKAMSRSLRDALDLTFQTFNQTTVTMVRLEKIGLEPWQTIVALFLVVIGFVVYYMIPYAFTFQDFALFFFILNSILLGMLIGLCLVAMVLQPILEHIVLFFILWGPDRRMKNLIEKNLAGHRKRSRQTYIMFTIATAFVIFAGVSFSLQTSAIVQNAENIIGTDIVVLSTTSRYALPQEELTAFMHRMQEENIVEDFAFVSFNMGKFPFVTRNRISTLSRFPETRIQAYTVPENYLRVCKSEYFLPTDIDDEFDYESLKDGKPDIIHSLYADAGQAHVSGEHEGYYPDITFSGIALNYPFNVTFDPSRAYSSYMDVILSTALMERLSMAIKHPGLLSLSVHRTKPHMTRVLSFLLKPKAFVYKFPGFVFSSYSVTARGSPMLLSEPQFQRMLKTSAKEVNIDPEQKSYLQDIPKMRLLIKLREGNTVEDEAIVLNGIRSQLDAELAVVQSVRDVVNSTATAESILNWAFNLLAALACILCFLNLMTAFTANVKDNQWIYGVLRSLGMSGFQLTRAYIYEALCLVLSAFFCGSIIGTLLALTLVLQQNLFLQNPLVFDFPWILFVSLLVMALSLAVLGSWIPIRALEKKDIAYILRGL